MSYGYGLAINSGALLPDDAALRDIEEALEIAERSSDDLALGFARFTLGVVLAHRDSPAERERALAVLLGPPSGRRNVGRAAAGQARRPRRCHTAIA